MNTNTKDKLLEQAEILFAHKGFYGTSINDVAFKVGVSKQGLLHHFSTKEKLYGAVLQQATTRLLMQLNQSKNPDSPPIEQLSNIFKHLNCADEQTQRVMNLLLRELLDNKDKTQNNEKEYLKSLLDELVALVEAAQNQGFYRNQHPVAFVYHLLGATQYYLVSQPRLKKLYSEQEFVEHQQHHLQLIDKMLKQ